MGIKRKLLGAAVFSAAAVTAIKRNRRGFGQEALSTEDVLISAAILVAAHKVASTIAGGKTKEPAGGDVAEVEAPEILGV